MKDHLTQAVDLLEKPAETQTSADGLTALLLLPGLTDELRYLRERVVELEADLRAEALRLQASNRALRQHTQGGAGWRTQ